MGITGAGFAFFVRCCWRLMPSQPPLPPPPVLLACRWAPCERTATVRARSRTKCAKTKQRGNSGRYAHGWGVQGAMVLFWRWRGGSLSRKVGQTTHTSRFRVTTTQLLSHPCCTHQLRETHPPPISCPPVRMIMCTIFYAFSCCWENRARLWHSVLTSPSTLL